MPEMPTTSTPVIWRMSTPPVSDGHGAGAACIELMRRARANLPPEHICEVYNDLGGGKSSPTIHDLWDELGDATVRCIKDGARTLAMIWESAYGLASKPAFKGPIDGAGLRKMYEKKTFVESKHLAHLDAADYASTEAAHA